MSTLTKMLRKARTAVLRRGVSPEDADELVQEAYLRVEQYERRHSLRSQEAMLVTAAVNLSIDRARRQRRAPFDDIGEKLLKIADRTPQPDEIVRSQQRLRHAAASLDRLSERSRRILLARRVDDESYQQIAEREGMTVAAIEKRVARATLDMMKWMDEW